jgi:hypothetical protein
MLRAVGGSLLPYAGSFTYATLPAAAGVSGYQAFATDLGANGTLLISNGTRWRPINGQTVLKDKGAAQSGITNAAEVIVIQTLLPVGSWQTSDTIRIVLALTKSGTTNSAICAVRCGTPGLITDTAILPAGGVIGAAGRSIGLIFDFHLESATSVQKVGSQIDNGSAYGVQSTTAAQSPVTITSAAANALYISVGLSSNGAADTVAIQSGQIILVTP